MIKFCSLVSGSSGNAIYLQHNNTRILIDCGVSARRIKALLNDISENANDIDAVLITHEHSDHISGVRVFAKSFNIPVFASNNTWNAMEKIGEEIPSLARRFDKNNPFEVGSIGVEAFEIPHDATDPVGYIFHMGNKKIGIATDMGQLTTDISKKLKGSQAVLLEANYDVKMLSEGKYPYFLKNRISGSNGHLSNEQSANIACALVRTGTDNIILGHLSVNNNTPEIAYSTVCNQMAKEEIKVGKDIILNIAKRYSFSNIL